MSRYNHRHKLSGRELFLRVAFLAVVVGTLAFFVPRGTSHKHKYAIGEPWDENPVIAEDSFPIYKSAATLERERDSLRQYYEPYFHRNPQVLEEQKKALAEAFAQLPKGSIPYYYLPHLTEKLTYIYNQGVVENEAYDKLTHDQTQQIRVYEQNESSTRYIKQVFTQKTAYKYMTTEVDSTRYVHKKLAAFNLTPFIQPNLIYDAEKSIQQRQEVDALLVPYMGQVQVGQKLVDRGQIVDGYTYCVLQSMERNDAEKSLSKAELYTQIAGQTFYIGMLATLLLLYFSQFRNDYLQDVRSIMLISSMSIIFPLLTFALMSHHLMSVYVIPYCVLPIFIRVFMDSRTAFITHLLTILISAVALNHPYEFIITQSVAGLVAVYSLRQLSERSELFRAAVLVTGSTISIYFCMELLNGKTFSMEGFDRWTYIYLTIAGILSLISYLLLIPIERIFGFTSTVTLVELSNINTPILRRLSEEAPGTFQHSMQVANLASEVANSIGAKSQLVRTGALYHDIGKLQNPVFFTENQSGTNPHNQLSYERSAQIIISHVTDGIRLADKYKLPAVIKDFIVTHHGKSMARYFYISYKNAFPDIPVDESLFTYPGPNPTTLEQAILMMADSVEAASRSLQEYTEDNLNAMVDKIIDGQVSAGYFAQCPISFLEIDTAKNVFKKKLRTIYHTRIQYPELNK